MKVKGIFAIAVVAAILGAGLCWARSDYAKHWLPWEIGAYAGLFIFLGGLVWLFFAGQSAPSSKLPD